MSVVAAADYRVSPGNAAAERIFPELSKAVQGLLERSEVTVLRKTKRGEKETDIRPWIFLLEQEENSFFMRLAAGSVHNLKPESVLDALAAAASAPLSEARFDVCRCAVYAESGGQESTHVPLDALGETF